METNNSSAIKVKEAIKEFVTIRETMQHYVWREGFVFAKGYKDKIFDEIIVRSPVYANCDTPIYPIANKTIDDYIEVINGAELYDALVVAKDLSFLTKCPSLKFLTICPADDLDGILDFSPLYDSKNIKSLCVEMTYGAYPNTKQIKNAIDYSKIEGLQRLHLNFDSNNHTNFNRINTLKTLSISQYPKRDLKELFTSKILDSLLIIISKISTLDGISQSECMQCLYLCYNRSLNDISALKDVSKTIKALKIEKCPKISDFSVLEELTNLEFLVLKGSNKLPNLQFLKKLKKLKIFIFDMEIEDGDLTPCLSVPFVSCKKNHKKYNLKPMELPGKTVDFKNTGMENIEFWRRLDFWI